MNTIIPSHWGLSLIEFRKWANRTGAIVGLVLHDTMGDREEEFYFVNEQDLIAFKMTFKETKGILGYKGFTTKNAGSYYCPYLPFRK